MVRAKPVEGKIHLCGDFDDDFEDGAFDGTQRNNEVMEGEIQLYGDHDGDFGRGVCV